jgi:hypothetical protein
MITAASIHAVSCPSPILSQRKLPRSGELTQTYVRGSQTQEEVLGFKPFPVRVFRFEKHGNWKLIKHTFGNKKVVSPRKYLPERDNGKQAISNVSKSNCQSLYRRKIDCRCEIALGICCK